MVTSEPLRDIRLQKLYIDEKHHDTADRGTDFNSAYDIEESAFVESTAQQRLLFSLTNEVSSPCYKAG